MKFLPRKSFEAGHIRLLPIRFRRMPDGSDRVLISSVSGQWLIAPRTDLESLVDGSATFENNPSLPSLLAKGMATSSSSSFTGAILSQVRTRRAHVSQGPALHIFVVTLRCDHSCRYCQVSRQSSGALEYDMSEEAAALAIERVFEWPAKDLTIEFQGGEPLLAFDRIRQVIQLAEARARTTDRRVKFVVATTLHHLTDEQLSFLAHHRVHLSTSLDGPAHIHNANRPLPSRDSHSKTISALERARKHLGNDGVAALTTITRRSLSEPEQIIDEYARLGFGSIFLRPLSPYGFARNNGRDSYSGEEFLQFYKRALRHLIQMNIAGQRIEESYAALLLGQILSPQAHGYVDLRSPAGAGLGAMVYNYNGRAYVSDEARMLAEMGDESFCVGKFEAPISSWIQSPAFGLALSGAVAESMPLCDDCAFLPFCGADPVDHYARYGDPVGHRPTSSFCQRHIGVFELLFEYLDKGTDDERRVLMSWGLRTTISSDLAIGRVN